MYMERFTETAKLFIIMLVFSMGIPSMVYGADLYIAVGGSDSTGDGTAGSPFGTIQKGIDTAAAGDTVILKDGTYSGPGNYNLDPGGKFITIRSENGPEAAIIDCQDNGRGFYFHNFELESTAIDGLTIRNGNAESFTEPYGGGIYCLNAFPTIRNCIIEDCIAEIGGGVYGSVSLLNTLIQNNTATFEATEHNKPGGGGIAFAEVISGCTITGNQATDATGGGVFGARLIEHSTISNNSASDTNPDYGGQGGGIANWGGGTYRTCFIKDCIITNNSASSEGGGIGNRDIKIFRSTISGNSAPKGGGISFTVYSASNKHFKDCLIMDNTATSGDGGGLLLETGSVITNCTIVNNSAAGKGGGISSIDNFSNSLLANSIVWNNTADGSNPQINQSTLEVTFSCVQGGQAGTGNIDLDPGFISASENDFRLGAASPCRNIGSPHYAMRRDREGKFRDHLPDLGAFERFSAIQKTEYWVSPSGSDTTGNGTAGLPFRTLQHAIDAAGTSDEVIAAAGTYTGEGNKNLKLYGKAITIRSESGPEVTIIDCENAGRGFKLEHGRDDDAIIKGLTITNGNVTSGIFSGYSFGGGIFAGAPAIIEDCIITNCHADPTATMSGTGGAIYGAAIIRNCEIRDNTAGANAGIDGATSVTGSIISNNHSSDTYGVGGVSADFIANCEITDNSAPDDGGGVLLYSGRLKDCSITGNASGGVGGGITAYNSIIENCLIAENTAHAMGGGINASGTMILNCIINNNESQTDSGGGINAAATDNGQIRHCTIYNNHAATDGGGISNDGSSIINSIIWGNTANGAVSQIYSIGTGTVSGSCIEGSYTGTGNISFDPEFTDAVNGDFSLEVSSPCIDAGLPEMGIMLDYTHQIRFDTPDMGAYEYNGSVQPTYTINASSGSEGSITPPGILVLDAGANQTYSIIPDNGFEVDTLTVDGIDLGPIAEYTFWSINCNHTIAVTFKETADIDTYSISGQVTGTAAEGVTVTLSGDASLVTVTDINGFYSFNGIINGSYTVTPTNAETDFEPQSAPVLISDANAASIDFISSIKEYTVTINNGAHGSSSPTGNTAVLSGGNLSIAISPDSGYIINQILVNSASQTISNPFVLTDITADQTIDITYAALPQFTVTVNGGTGGTVSPNGTVTVYQGSDQTFTINPDTGHIIDSIQVDGNAQAVSSTFTITNITADHTLDVTFAALAEYTITVINGAGGTISPSGPVQVYEGEDISFTITPDSGYVISAILLDSVSQTIQSPFTINNVTGDMSLAIEYTSTTSEGEKSSGCMPTASAPAHSYALLCLILLSITAGFKRGSKE